MGPKREQLALEEPSGSPTAKMYRRLRRDPLAVEGAKLDRLYQSGQVTDTTRRRLQRALDFEYAGLGDDDP